MEDDDDNEPPSWRFDTVREQNYTGPVLNNSDIVTNHTSVVTSNTSPVNGITMETPVNSIPALSYLEPPVTNEVNYLPT